MGTTDINSLNLLSTNAKKTPLENEYDPETNQPKYPCPSCKYDCENFDCILCNCCNNWFHQSCAKISNKRFKILSNSTRLKFKCKFCLSKNQKCSGCEKDVCKKSLKKLYCVSCKDWFCKDCLPLSTHEIKEFMTTERPFFAKTATQIIFVPYVMIFVGISAYFVIIVRSSFT